MEARARRTEALYTSFSNLARDPQWPAGTASQAATLWQGMHDVVLQAVEAVEGYLRAAPRPYPPATGSRCLHRQHAPLHRHGKP